MKALSVKLPWAWLECKGFKPIENRTWPIDRTPPRFSCDTNRPNFYIPLPSRIYIHAGKSGDFSSDTERFLIDRGCNLKERDFAPGMFGAIIGAVDIVACVDRSDSQWFVGRYGFVLEAPELFEAPIPCRGSLGFFDPQIEARYQSLLPNAVS